jgi:hypothetical protein
MRRHDLGRPCRCRITLRCLETGLFRDNGNLVDVATNFVSELDLAASACAVHRRDLDQQVPVRASYACDLADGNRGIVLRELKGTGVVDLSELRCEACQGDVVAVVVDIYAAQPSVADFNHEVADGRLDRVPAIVEFVVEPDLFSAVTCRGLEPTEEGNVVDRDLIAKIRREVIQLDTGLVQDVPSWR